MRYVEFWMLDFGFWMLNVYNFGSLTSDRYFQLSIFICQLSSTTHYLQLATSHSPFAIPQLPQCRCVNGFLSFSDNFL